MSDLTSGLDVLSLVPTDVCLHIMAAMDYASIVAYYQTSIHGRDVVSTPMLWNNMIREHNLSSLIVLNYKIPEIFEKYCTIRRMYHTCLELISNHPTVAFECFHYTLLYDTDDEFAGFKLIQRFFIFPMNATHIRFCEHVISKSPFCQLIHVSQKRYYISIALYHMEIEAGNTIDTYFVQFVNENLRVV